MDFSVATFGEIMLRLTPQKPFGRLTTSRELEMDFAGAESNVATALTCLGVEAAFITKLPENYLGEAAIQRLNNFGVNTQHVIRGGKRIGIYFIEQGFSIRSSKVLYDRDHSAIQSIQPLEFDWHQILHDHDWFHVSGITPSLSDQCAEECLKAVRTAKALGVEVSFDLNFRRKMWKDTTSARKIFEEIIAQTGLLIANEGALSDVFGITSREKNTMERTRTVSEKAAAMFGTPAIALTCRNLISSNRNSWSGMLLSENTIYESRTYDLEIADRFGTGDAFAAGLIYGYANSFEKQSLIEFAVAASALKHTISGDLNIINQDEVKSIIEGNIKGHIER